MKQRNTSEIVNKLNNGVNQKHSNSENHTQERTRQLSSIASKIKKPREDSSKSGVSELKTEPVEIGNDPLSRGF